MIYLLRFITWGHNGGFDRSGTPIRVQRLQQTNNAGDMRTGHGRAGVDVELDRTVIEGQACRAGSFTVRGYDVHSWSSNVGLPQPRHCVIIINLRIYRVYQETVIYIIWMKTLRISGVTLFGPLEEKAAMNGAGFVSTTALGAVMKPSGSLLKIYLNEYMRDTCPCYYIMKLILKKRDWALKWIDRVLILLVLCMWLSNKLNVKINW